MCLLVFTYSNLIILVLTYPLNRIIHMYCSKLINLLHYLLLFLYPLDCNKYYRYVILVLYYIYEQIMCLKQIWILKQLLWTCRVLMALYNGIFLKCIHLFNNNIFCTYCLTRNNLGTGKTNRPQITYRLKENRYMNRNAFDHGKY